MLRIAAPAHELMLVHAYDGLPHEACGLLGGSSADGTVDVFVRCQNADASSRTYSIGPADFMAAERMLDPLGLEIVGVMHSHTHTDPYPSPTDVAKADNPLLEGWHYVIVSLREDVPMLRSWLLDGGTIVEEPVVVVRQPPPTQPTPRPVG
ncbi:MAG: putative metal-dependent protease of the superfamily [Acidimicrobiales bacterium]|nr:putative metal-dependent protease of the superfamily [Acidimicrobiales bacterium]